MEIFYQKERLKEKSAETSRFFFRRVAWMDLFYFFN